MYCVLSFGHSNAGDQISNVPSEQCPCFLLAVLSKLYQNDELLSKMECTAVLSRLGYKDLGSSWLFGIIKSQEMKSVDVVDATVDILESHHFNEYAKILQGICLYVLHMWVHNVWIRSILAKFPSSAVLVQRMTVYYNVSKCSLF